MKNVFFMVPVLLFWACGNQMDANKEDVVAAFSDKVVLTEGQLKNVDVAVEVPARREGTTSITVRGEISAPPQNKISVTSLLGGHIKKITLHIGDRVKKGDVLATLENMQYIQLQQDFLSGKTKLAQLKNEAERQEQLSQTQASSQKQAEAARAEYENQKIQQKSLSEKLRLLDVDAELITPENMSGTLTLRSPINGFVTAVNTNIGQYVSGADVLMELVDPSDIHLSLQVFEKDLPYIEIGQELVAFTNTNPEKKYSGHIVLVGKSILPDKSVEVHGHFDSFPPGLIPGLYMNAEIKVKSTEQNAVPKDAVMGENGKPYVFAETGNNTFELIPVQVHWQEKDTVGISNENGTPIEHKLVTKNAYILYMQLQNR